MRGCIAAFAAALVLSSPAFAQQYPSKPVKIIVPFPPAGVTDIVARLVAQKLSEKLGEQFYVENIAGAGGNLGMGQAARAPADGYTILFPSSSIVVNPSLYSKVPFDLDKDFAPVTKAGATPNSWQVNPDFPASTMTALIDIIRKEPGKYNVAARLLELGVVPGGESSAEFAGYVKAEVAKWRKVITEAKVPPIGG